MLLDSESPLSEDQLGSGRSGLFESSIGNSNPEIELEFEFNCGEMKKRERKGGERKLKCWEWSSGEGR